MMFSATSSFSSISLDSCSRFVADLVAARQPMVRRRLAEMTATSRCRIIRSIIPRVAKARRRKSVKTYLDRISPRHIRVIQEYAAGKGLAEIAREKNRAAKLFLRILRRLRSDCSNLAQSSGLLARREDFRGEGFTEDSSGSSQRRSDDLNIVKIMNIAERIGYMN